TEPLNAAPVVAARGAAAPPPPPPGSNRSPPAPARGERGHSGERPKREDGPLVPQLPACPRFPKTFPPFELTGFEAGRPPVACRDHGAPDQRATCDPCGGHAVAHGPT